jgi:molybdopterin converting factor small subunit
MLRNGRNIRFQEGLDTPLSATDTINCFPKMGAQRAFARD